MSYDYFNTYKYEEALLKAVELDWEHKKVQVRVEFEGEKARYYIEPFEKDCTCPHILKYDKHIKPL